MVLVETRIWINFLMVWKKANVVLRLEEKVEIKKLTFLIMNGKSLKTCLKLRRSLLKSRFKELCLKLKSRLLRREDLYQVRYQVLLSLMKLYHLNLIGKHISEDLLVYLLRSLLERLGEKRTKGTLIILALR